MPNSERLMVATASAPHASFLAKGLGAQWNAVMVRVTGLVTPSSVNSPGTEAGLSPLKVDPAST